MRMLTLALKVCKQKRNPLFCFSMQITDVAQLSEISNLYSTALVTRAIIQK